MLGRARPCARARKDSKARLASAASARAWTFRRSACWRTTARWALKRRRSQQEARRWSRSGAWRGTFSYRLLLEASDLGTLRDGLPRILSGLTAVRLPPPRLEVRHPTRDQDHVTGTVAAEPSPPT